MKIPLTKIFLLLWNTNLLIGMVLVTIEGSLTNYHMTAYLLLFLIPNGLYFYFKNKKQKQETTKNLL